MWLILQSINWFLHEIADFCEIPLYKPVVIRKHYVIPADLILPFHHENMRIDLSLCSSLTDPQRGGTESRWEWGK